MPAHKAEGTLPLKQKRGREACTPCRLESMHEVLWRVLSWIQLPELQKSNNSLLGKSLFFRRYRVNDGMVAYDRAARRSSRAQPDDGFGDLFSCTKPPIRIACDCTFFELTKTSRAWLIAPLFATSPCQNTPNSRCPATDNVLGYRKNPRGPGFSWSLCSCGLALIVPQGPKCLKKVAHML